MKGVVFTEFLEMVESEFGFVVVDKITSLPELRDHGSYTSVGNYPHGDMIAMIGKLSEMVGLEAGDLVKAFGRYLFRSFAKSNGEFFVGVSDAFDFLSGIETVIHTEVRKLHDDVELPQFECERIGDTVLVMEYESKRPFADLAEGLIRESLEHFSDKAVLERHAGPSGDAHTARFVLTRP